MKRLKSARLIAYLAGRMGGNLEDKAWRDRAKPSLIKLAFKPASPYDMEPAQLRGLRPGRLPSKAPDGRKIQHWYHLRFFPRHTPEYARFKKYMSLIVKFDLRFVRDKADIIIARWDIGCQTGAGTASEISLAHLCDKPVYLWNDGVKDIPEWLEGCCTEIFDSLEKLLEFLKEEYDRDESVDISCELIN